jgi:hypothetical protein
MTKEKFMVVSCDGCPALKEEIPECNLAEVHSDFVMHSWFFGSPPPDDCPLRERAVILYLDEEPTKDP